MPLTTMAMMDDTRIVLAHRAVVQTLDRHDTESEVYVSL